MKLPPPNFYSPLSLASCPAPDGEGVAGLCGRAACPHCPQLTPWQVLLPIPTPCLDNAERLCHVLTPRRPHPSTCHCLRAQGRARHSPHALPSTVLPLNNPNPKRTTSVTLLESKHTPGCSKARERSSLPTTLCLLPVPCHPPMREAVASPLAALWCAAAELGSSRYLFPRELPTFQTLFSFWLGRKTTI